MKKIISIILLVMIFAVMLSSCDINQPIADSSNTNYRFVKVIDQYDTDDSGMNYQNCCVFVDKQTGVMYLFVRVGSHGGMTVLLNADGTPMIYDCKKDND